MSYFKELAPDLDRIVVADMFGGMLSGSELDPRTRSLCIVSMLATMAGREVQLKYHIGGALNVGVTKAEIVEALKQVFFFAGLPAAATGLKIAEGVFAERGL
jgi:4-carboxymuconolactone decarboxylase